ncbi:MAG: hypothetical protein HYY67_01375 [Thaumarchaeota archaeon]|nr:hypothetical protein [Nitrososphaerota archaeon]
MAVDSKILVSFAKDLEALVEDFREEMEILSNKTMMEQIKKTKQAKKKKQLLSFASAEDFLREVKAQ